MDGAIRETTRRRNRQLRHNEANGIVPFQPGRRATHSARNAVLDALLEGQPARPKAVRAARGGTSQKVAAEAAALPPAAQSEEARRDDGDTAAGHIGEATFTPERGSMYPTAPVEAAFDLSATGV